MDVTHKWDNFYTSDSRESFLHFTNDQVVSILRDFPLAKTALDIGCGEGQLMLQLEAADITTTGIDLSKVALAEARKQVKGTLLEGNFEQWEFLGTQKFDLIFAKFLIAFIENRDKFFSKIRSLLQEDGGFILMTPIIDQKSLEPGSEVFIEQSVLDTYLPAFSTVKEQILYSETGKRLSLFICRK